MNYVCIMNYEVSVKSNVFSTQKVHIMQKKYVHSNK